jgi:hypothetical protein
MSVSPVFLVAVRRSGTNLMRLMLASHPDLHWERGWEYVTEIIGPSGEAPSPAQLNELRARFGIEEPDDEPIALSGDDALQPLRTLLEAHIERQLEREEKQVFGATVKLRVDRLAYLWPNAKFIHLLRDPRDVALSVHRIGWESTFWHAAGYWAKGERDWKVLESRIAAESWIEIRYEDLVAQAETVLHQVCEFVGIPYTERLFDYTLTSTYGMPDPSLAERWRGKISARNVSLVEARVGDMMLNYGYERAGPLRSPGRLEAFILEAQNETLDRTRRIKEEGLFTFGLGVLVNRFNLSSLEGRLAARRKSDQLKRVQALESNYRNVERR